MGSDLGYNAELLTISVIGPSHNFKQNSKNYSWNCTGDGWAESYGVYPNFNNTLENRSVGYSYFFPENNSSFNFSNDIIAFKNPNLKLIVNEKNKEMIDGQGKNISAINYNYTNYLPLRFLADSLGFRVTFIPEIEAVFLDYIGK